MNQWLGTQERFRACCRALIWTCVVLSLLIWVAQLGCSKKSEASTADRTSSVVFTSMGDRCKVFRIQDGFGALYIAVDQNGVITSMATRKY